MLDLTHLAQSVAQSFVSLDLAHDAGQLTRLGPGRLTLDLLQRDACHQYTYVPFLRIGDNLRYRMLAELQRAGLPPANLRRAQMEIDCSYRTIPNTDTIRVKGINWCGDAGPLVEATLAVTVRLGTAEGQWQAQHRGIMIWPETWRDRL